MPNIDYDGYPNSFTYEAWQMITARDSQQYKLKDEAGMNFDSEGFGKIGDRYVIACTEHFGSIGDALDFVLHNGNTLHCIIGDFKSSGDDNYSEYGHITGGSLNVIEFIVDYDTWYYPMHANPGTSSCHPEWAGQLQSYEKAGNYWTGITGVANTLSCPIIIVEGKRVLPSLKIKTTVKDGDLAPVRYIATFQSQGYIYFNDDLRWRCTIDGENLQLCYGDKQMWVATDLIKDLKVTICYASSAYGNGAISPNANVEAAVQWAIEKCKSGKVTYPAPYANRNVRNPNGWVYDCSSFVITAFYVGGYDTTCYSTHDMLHDFRDNLGFTWIPMTHIPANACQRGDILLREYGGPGNGHTQLYIGNNQDANAGGTPARIVTHEEDGYGYGWDGILRPPSGGGTFGGGSGGIF